MDVDGNMDVHGINRYRTKSPDNVTQHKDLRIDQ